MKKLLIKMSLLCGMFFMFISSFSGCGQLTTDRLMDSFGSNKPKVLTANQLTSKLKAAGLPIGNVIVYTEANDPNKFLGRPNQYISKANFVDTQLQQMNTTNPNGGSIETFKNANDLKARKEYIETIMKSSPMFTEYMVVNGNYLLRLSKDLTNDQVNKYRQVFMAIK